MKPKMPVRTHQTDLFSVRLSDFLNQRHELVQLAKIIDWDTLDTEFGQFFEPIIRCTCMTDPIGCRVTLSETCLCSIG
jgi:hypothetical protein